MTTTTATESTTYYVSIPVVTTVSFQVQLPAGLTNVQVLDHINWESTRNIEYDHTAIRSAAIDSVDRREMGIEIESDD